MPVSVYVVLLHAISSTHPHAVSFTHAFCHTITYRLNYMPYPLPTLLAFPFRLEMLLLLNDIAYNISIRYEINLDINKNSTKTKRLCTMNLFMLHASIAVSV